MSPGGPHLARRFFAVLRARPLRPAEQAAVARRLRPEERHLFWQQCPADQRHGLECSRAVLARCPDRIDLARAALLHDVGKGRAPLGVAARTLATALAACRLPTPGRLGAYMDHGPTGAAALEAAGAEPVVVCFARHHHTSRPEGIATADWEVLCRADHP